MQILSGDHGTMALKYNTLSLFRTQNLGLFETRRCAAQKQRVGSGNITPSLQPENYYEQVFNHFPDNTGLCTKTGLIKSLKQYNAGHEEARNLLTVFYWLMRNNGIGAAKYCVWDTIPTSFIIAAGLEDTEYHNFITRVKDLSKKDYQKESVPAKHCMENMWLIKPANLNQGNKNTYSTLFIQDRQRNRGFPYSARDVVLFGSKAYSHSMGHTKIY